jgi:thiol-disulfide isomerase/thioredoxin
MKFIHIDTQNYNVKDIKSKETPIKELKKYMNNDVFVLIYMEGCGPCNATRPEWKKLENVLKNDEREIIIVDIDKDVLDKIPFLKINPSGYPTIVYTKSNVTEQYEDSNIENKDRSVDSFVEWIESKAKANTKKGGKKRGTRVTKNTKKVVKRGTKETKKRGTKVEKRRTRGTKRKY